MICHSKSVDLDEILNRVSEEDILAHYFNVTTIPCVIKSPLRKDNHPSFAVYYTRGGNIAFKDFATQQGGGVIDLLQVYYHESFKDVLTRLYNDFKHHRPIVRPEHNTVINLIDKCQIKVRVREWQPYDLDWWQQFGITQEWLQFGNVYPISDIFLTKHNNTVVISADKYAYAYVEFKDGKETIKVYQPMSKYYKWLGTHDGSVWDLWNQLPPTGSRLIITSSRKDALCLWANLGIPSCCLQGEGMLPKDHVIQQLIDRFQQVYVLYDNDYNKIKNVGQLNAYALCQRYSLINICIPANYEAKDPSDLFKTHGREIFINVLKPQICI